MTLEEISMFATERKQRNFLRNFLEHLAEFIAPRHCVVCAEHIGFSERRLEFICEACLDGIPLPPSPEFVYSRFLENFSADDLSVSAADALILLKDGDKWMNAVHKLKYSGFKRVGTELGYLLGKKLKNDAMSNYDALIPIPIHSAKKRERGFNQSAFIAEGVSKFINVPVRNDILKRKIYTVSQTRLNQNERRSNVSSAFSPAEKSFEARGKRFLILDDVLTTGSTINSAAMCLLECGALRVDAAVLALA